MDLILDGLNSAQRTAVTSPASILQVLAPPGSGKTKTLAARVAYLLSHLGFRPQDVICCTFTIKASKEMRARISKIIGGKQEFKLILGTFHSICRRYLVKYGHLIGLKKGFGIADSNDSQAILKRIVKRLKSNIQPNIARSRISTQKAQGISFEELVGKRVKGVEQQEFVEIYREYELALSSSNLLDYDDLLLRCVDLLKQHPECVSNVQAVLVDEFQDTNRIQFELMNLFASQNRRITIVGDPDQSIYGFRSAEIKNLERMQRLYKDTSVVLLEENYRSSGSILTSAEDVIEQDVARPAKKLRPTHGVGTMPVLRKLSNAAAEANWLVLEIKRSIILTGNLLKYSDFAVLLRSATLSRQIESEMGKHGIPYRMVGGHRFFDRVEIKLLLDYLRVLSHPENTDALIRILNVPPRRIGDQSVSALTAIAEEVNMPLWICLNDILKGNRSTRKPLSKSAFQGLGTFVDLIESGRQKLTDCLDETAPRILLEFVIKRLAFREYLTVTYPLDQENRWANVEELIAQTEDTSSAKEAEQVDNLPEIEGIEQTHSHPGEEALTRFLANVALATEITTEDGGQQQEKVTISTIHAAKGLEWPVVFVPAVYEGIIPHSRAEDTDEERRLLYVAMTRAQALLYLSYPRWNSRNGEETTRTSFLPAAMVKTKFRSTGPKFLDKIVYNIADILRRPQPVQEDMIKGITELPSVYDDLWTEEGVENGEAATRWDGSTAFQLRDEQACKKRRKIEDAYKPEGGSDLVNAASYTMNNIGNFSVSTTTMSTGFSTARQQLALATTDRVKSSAVAGKNVETRKDSQKRGEIQESNRRRKLPDPTQGSLSDFFGWHPANQKKSPNGDFLSQSTNSTITASLCQQTSPINHDRHHQQTRPVVPDSLSKRRIQPQAFQPARPALESADPSCYGWLSESTQSTAYDKEHVHTKGGDNDNTTISFNPVITLSSTSAMPEGGTLAATPEVNAPTTTYYSRPDCTYHTSTTSTLQKQQTKIGMDVGMVTETGMGSGVTGSTITTGTERRTLGIRRTMHNGWAERMNRSR